MENLNSLHNLHTAGFQVLPVSILKSGFEDEKKKPIFEINDIFKPTGKPMIRSVDMQVAGDYVYTPYHYHEGIEILRFYGGEGSVVINNHVFPIHKGDIYIANAYEPHGIWLTDSHNYFERTCITFQPSAIFPATGERDLFAKLRNVMFDNHIPADSVAGSAICNCIDGITGVATKDTENWSVAVLGQLLLLYYYANNGGFTHEEGPATSQAQSEFMLKVSKYIDEHLTEDISTTAIAGHCQYTTEHFCRLFHSCFGSPFKKYLGAFRIQRAMSIMKKEPNHTVTEIATMVGFNNQNHFCNTFKKNVGKLPSEFLAHQRELAEERERERERERVKF